MEERDWMDERAAAVEEADEEDEDEGVSVLLGLVVVSPVSL